MINYRQLNRECLPAIWLNKGFSAQGNNFFVKSNTSKDYNMLLKIAYSKFRDGNGPHDNTNTPSSSDTKKRMGLTADLLISKYCKQLK